jgi:hypothetical protein
MAGPPQIKGFEVPRHRPSTSRKPSRGFAQGVV